MGVISVVIVNVVVVVIVVLMAVMPVVVMVVAVVAMVNFVVGGALVIWMKFYTEIIPKNKSVLFFALVFHITVGCFGCVDGGDGCGGCCGGSGSCACGEFKTTIDH